MKITPLKQGKNSRLYYIEIVDLDLDIINLWGSRYISGTACPGTLMNKRLDICLDVYLEQTKKDCPENCLWLGVVDHCPTFVPQFKNDQIQSAWGVFTKDKSWIADIGSLRLPDSVLVRRKSGKHFPPPQPNPKSGTVGQKSFVWTSWCTGPMIGHVVRCQIIPRMCNRSFICWYQYFFALLLLPYAQYADTVTLLSLENIVLNIATWDKVCLYFETNDWHICIINAQILQVRRKRQQKSVGEKQATNYIEETPKIIEDVIASLVAKILAQFLYMSLLLDTVIEIVIHYKFLNVYKRILFHDFTIARCYIFCQ